VIHTCVHAFRNSNVIIEPIIPSLANTARSISLNMWNSYFKYHSIIRVSFSKNAVIRLSHTQHDYSVYAIYVCILRPHKGVEKAV